MWTGRQRALEQHAKRSRCPLAAAPLMRNHAQLAAAREGMAAHIKELEAGLSGVRAELEARRVEVEQLTLLGLRGDATVQEYMSNIKVRAARLRCRGRATGRLPPPLIASAVPLPWLPDRSSRANRALFQRRVTCHAYARLLGGQAVNPCRVPRSCTTA